MKSGELPRVLNNPGSRQIFFCVFYYSTVRKLTWKSINVLVLFVLLKSVLIVKTLRFHFKNTLKENISLFLNLKVKDPQQFVYPFSVTIIQYLM